MPYRIGIDHCIEKMEEKWIITVMKLEWINPIELEWKSSWIHHSVNPSINQLFARVLINESQTMDLSI